MSSVLSALSLASRKDLPAPLRPRAITEYSGLGCALSFPQHFWQHCKVKNRWNKRSGQKFNDLKNGGLVGTVDKISLYLQVQGVSVIPLCWYFNYCVASFSNKPYQLSINFLTLIKLTDSQLQKSEVFFLFLIVLWQIVHFCSINYCYGYC